ncbi:AAA family ATPase [Delftia sp. RIT313]|uniref:AAA family ATPase n=1 Tax=Delftia sp. RIT313 TaxID=1468410 RepID=UPI000448FF91|nr:ATP-binding protein [Delftia sp. RIT313]EZP51816.1 recombination protein F [Delftia sp. RIT313]
MLIEFSLKEFKSFREATLPLGPLTVLIGANAAGKSNAIEALRLLSWLAQGQKLTSIQYEVNKADRVVRGRVSDLCHKGETKFTLGCRTDDSEWNLLEMQLSLRDGELHITSEKVDDYFQRVPLYTMDRPSINLSTDAGVAYNNFATGGNKPHVTVSDQMAVFVQFESAARFGAGHKKAQEVIPKVAKRYQNILSNILFLDPVPARMREYSFTTDKRLLGDGTNLSSVLHRLWGEDSDSQDEPYATQRRDILDFIQSLPEQDISGLSFLRGPRSEVMVQVQETFGGNPRDYDASLLSDGTLRVLAVAAAMLSATEGSLVVIEEIDNGVHPSRARHLLDSIRAIAERRKLRVLLSTHNPAMLDALPDVAVPDVVFCYRDPSGGDSKLIRMHNIPDVPDLLIQGPLGQLMTSGTLERFVKNHKGPRSRKMKAQAWLESLKAQNDGEER